jgi:TolA-binding protein
MAAKGKDGGETEESRRHAQDTKRLLQLVYGTQRSDEVSEYIAKNAAPITTAPPTKSDYEKSRNKRPRVESEHSQPTPLAPSQLQSMQREIQSLRDKNDHLIRKARAAEKEAAAATEERARRRTLEVRLGDMQRELDVLRITHRENDEILVKERHARRFLEETLAAERERARELEDQLKGRRAPSNGRPYSF